MSSFLCCCRQKKGKKRVDLETSVANIKPNTMFVRSSTLEHHGKLLLLDTQADEGGRRQGKFHTLSMKKIRKNHPLADYVYPRTENRISVNQ